MRGTFASITDSLRKLSGSDSQQRFFAYFALAMAFASASSTAFTSPIPSVVFTNTLSAACWLLLIAGMRLGLSNQQVCHIASSLACIAVFMEAWYAGGIYASALVWLVVLVTADYFILGARSALAWLLVCISVHALLVMSDELMGVVPDVQGLAPHQSATSLLDNTIVFIVIGLVTFFYRRSDIKNFRQLRAQQQDLTEQRAQLERTMAARDQFIAAVNHEVKNPLHAIAALSEALLADAEQAPDVCMVLEHCSASALQASATVADLLDYTRLQSGQLQVRPQALQIPVEMHTAYALLQTQKKNPGVRCALEIDSALVAPLHSDKALLALCLQKLMDNACRFTTSGHITLTAHRSGNDGVIFAVEDSGTGMSPAAKDRLSQNLRDNAPALIKGGQGAGLGLLVVQGVVRLLGGSLGFESSQYQGSRFWIRLPLQNTTAATSTPTAAKP